MVTDRRRGDDCHRHVEPPSHAQGCSENWRRPGTEEWLRTFAIITASSNDLVGRIYNRMPVIIAPEDYTRWLSSLDPDPRDLLVPYPSPSIKNEKVTVSIIGFSHGRAAITVADAQIVKMVSKLGSEDRLDELCRPRVHW